MSLTRAWPPGAESSPPFVHLLQPLSTAQPESSAYTDSCVRQTLHNLKCLPPAPLQKTFADPWPRAAREWA